MTQAPLTNYKDQSVSYIHTHLVLFNQPSLELSSTLARARQTEPLGYLAQVFRTDDLPVAKPTVSNQL